jgi:hypothetical protein
MQKNAFKSVSRELSTKQNEMVGLLPQVYLTRDAKVSLQMSEAIAPREWIIEIELTYLLIESNELFWMMYDLFIHKEK